MHVILLAGLLIAAESPAQDPVAAARELYASAAFEEALATLDHVNPSAPDGSREADQYRALCLYALGRIKEADSVTESLVRRDPLVALNADEASPRIVEMITNVRKRLLPGLIREKF